MESIGGFNLKSEPRPFGSKGNGRRPYSGSISSPTQKERSNKEGRTDPNGDCGSQRVIPHVEGGVLDRLCGGVHSLLGLKVRYLVILGFVFAAIAGIGGGLILNNFDRKRKWQIIGWLTLFTCLPLGAFCLLLGLP